MKEEDRRNRPVFEKREYHTDSFGIFFGVESILYSGRSRFQNIEIFANKSFGNVLILDGLVQTTEKDEFFYHEMLVHPAFTAHPSPQSALIIGGGDGGITKEILRYPVERVKQVEIDAAVIAASEKFFPWLSSARRDPRYELLIGDGAEYVRTTAEKYDIILVDSSEPIGPSRVLHNKAFYENVKRRLNPEGVIAAQAGSPFYHFPFIQECLSFLKKIFKIARLYTGPVPSYPGGGWCYAFLSAGTDPLQLKKNPPPGLKYYNHDVHKAAFALPAFMKTGI